MTQYEFEQKVKLIISEQIGVDFVEITNSAHIEDDLIADSLDKVELVMALEEEFDVEISDDLAEKSLTVERILFNLAYLAGYTFYSSGKPSDNSNASLVSNPPPVKEIPLEVHTEPSGSVKPLLENEVFDAMIELSKKTKMLVDFSPCGKVSIEPEEYKDFDERFIVDNYDDFAKVVGSLEILNKFRGD